MQGKRTGIDFSKHELFATQQDGLLVHHLKKPDTNCDNVKFINTHGIMAVTGDYGNWIFCREFHPSATGAVSDGYWKEKLTNSSSQEPNEFDEEGTVAEVESLLEEEEDLTDEELEYLNECVSESASGELDYTYHAHRNNVGRFSDHEYVPLVMKTKHWLLVVFDAFDEICRRIKLENTTA